MTDEQKFAHLLKVLKNYAQQPTCYNLNPDYEYPHHSWDIFEDGSDYGEIMFARTNALVKKHILILFGVLKRGIMRNSQRVRNQNSGRKKPPRF